MFQDMATYSSSRENKEVPYYFLPTTSKFKNMYLLLFGQLIGRISSRFFISVKKIIISSNFLIFKISHAGA